MDISKQPDSIKYSACVIMNYVKPQVILNTAYWHYISLITHIDNPEDEHPLRLNFTRNTSMNIEKHISKSSLRNLYQNYKEQQIDAQKVVITFSEWLNENRIDGSDIIFRNDDLIIIELGTVIIQILSSIGLVQIGIERMSRTRSHSILVVPDKIRNVVGKGDSYVLPFRLPMIVEPAPSSRNKLGGYLLNDEEENEIFITPKHAYKIESTLDNKNIVYDMMNKINKTPYLINTKVFDFLLENWEDFGLLISEVEKYKSGYLDKRNKAQDKS